MDPKHFDKLAQSVGRRSILGGALAGILGLGTAQLADAAKGDKKAKTAAKKKDKGRVGKEQNLCGPGACPPGTCCTPTGAGNNVSCTPLTALVNTQVCGPAPAAGGVSGTCRTCAPGTRCAPAPGGPAGATVCVCDAASCATGCCAGVDQTPTGGTNSLVCIQNGSGQPVSQNIPAGGTSGAIPSGTFVCGVGGGACNACNTGGATRIPCVVGGACPAGATCVPLNPTPTPPPPGTPGVCTGPAGTIPGGGPQVFTGCCSAQGVCQAGTATVACGTAGQLCVNCTTQFPGNTTVTCGVGQSCTAQPAPPPAPPCPAGLTLCGNLCLDVATNPGNCGQCGRACPACGRRRTTICVGGNCGCSGRRRRRRRGRRRGGRN